VSAAELVVVAAYRAMLEDWDVEDAPTRFAVETQGQGFSGRFL
jgi:hypothetical protein